LKQQALEAGAQEALLIRDGFLTEGAASNAYVVIDGTIYTSPKDEKVLPGITRDVVLKLAKENNLPLIEQAPSLEQLQSADEIWMSSSTKEVLPITELDGKAVGQGEPGTVWQQMDALYQAYKRKG
jgi:D-alanine transaminase